MPVIDRVEAHRATQARDSSGQGALESRLAVGRDLATPGGRSGADARLQITAAYWPCLLSWARGEPTDAVLEQLRREARGWDSGSMLISVDSRTQLLLFVDDSLRGPDRRRLHNAVSAVIEAVKAGRPGTQIHAVIGDRMRPEAPLALVASRLRRLGNALAREGDAVIWARRDSLAQLLEALDPRQVSAFIQGQLASLQAYDHEHGTNLQRVVELALDHDSRNAAARAAFMHRNTFRRQLRKALELIEVDLDSPGERLALHLALKMRALARSAGCPGPRTGSAAPVRTPGSPGLAASSRGAP